MYQRRGFTLIELLVVIAIIGILATMVITSLLVARTKAYNATAQSDVTEMNKGVQLFETDDTNASQAAPVVNGNGANGGSNSLSNTTCPTVPSPITSTYFTNNPFCYIFSGTTNTTLGTTPTGITKTATGTGSNGVTYTIYTNTASAAAGGMASGTNASGYIVSTTLLTTGTGSNVIAYYQDGRQYSGSSAPSFTAPY